MVSNHSVKNKLAFLDVLEKYIMEKNDIFFTPIFVVKIFFDLFIY